MALLRQIFNGVRHNSLNVSASADDLDALKSLLEGKVEEWESKAIGGTKTAMPDVLNTKKFVCKKDSKSCAFRVFHIDPQKSDEDIIPSIVGSFDVGYYDNAEKCDEAYEIYDK